MPDKRRPSMETLTPVPSEDIRALSRNVNKIGTAVAGIEGSVGTIQNDLLPPVTRAAQEARDGVLRLDERVHALEDKPLPEYRCTELERQSTQDTAIAAAGVQVQHNAKMLWWLVGLLVAVGSSAFGFALITRSTTATATAGLQELDGVDEDVARHAVRLDALERARAEDRRALIREIRAVPQKVQSTSPPAAQVSTAVDGLPLRPVERRQILDILRRARGRENNGNR